MQPTKQFVRGAVRTFAFATVCLGALPAMAGPGPGQGPVTVLAPAATPTGGAVHALSGTLSPFGGTLSPFSGTLSPFSGTLSPFYGTLSPFYGTLSPFSGTLSPFSGTLSPFSGTLSPFSGTLSPFWGDLTAYKGQYALSSGVTAPDFANMQAFWNGTSSQWGDLNTGWAASKTTADYTAVAGQLSAFVASSQSFWGAAVTARTGKSFNDGFAAPLFAKYGIDPTNPDSLANLSQNQRSSFLVAWFDGLMDYAGVDHVDHWMNEVNWSPYLTQIQSSGSNSVIGLLDFTAQSSNITTAAGVSSFSNGHGTAVASLMVAPHDGVGVMGIAPRASVVAYNPFDSTGTANWTDITNGAIMLERNNASIINASLGVTGYTLHPDWNTVLTNKDLRATKDNVVFVIAAGNDGISQTTNVEWDKKNAQFLLVGSVDPNLNISAFSNRPGTACLTQGGKCTGDYLMNHFIVASGENMLVATDDGGLTRMSGTSFAAPLVSGAIALLHDRWPWLAQHPVDTINIITKSAKDLGAPGVDPVYGAGLLDVTASQSPLNFDSLQWYSWDTSAKNYNQALKPTKIQVLRDPKQQATWEASGFYVYAYENLSETFRDFAIPLSSKLMGQSVPGANGQTDMLQAYLTSSFRSWLGTGPAAPAPPAPKAFLNFRGEDTIETPMPAGFKLSFGSAPRTEEQGWRQSGLGFTSHVSLSTTDGTSGLKFGYGEGAASVAGVTGLALHSDYDPSKGGANPLLGFASGGAFGSVDLGIAPRLKLTGGVTTRDAKRNLDDFSGQNRIAALAVGDYKSTAARVGFTWRATDTLQVTTGFTRLNERNALLGVQSTDPADLSHGSTTEGVDLGADLALGHGLTLSGSATSGKVQQTGVGGQNLTVGSGGVSTSSFQVALAKVGVLQDDDRVRFSLSQPLHVESGKFNYTGVEVIDRQTGELGPVTHSFAANSGERPFVAEMLYGRSIFNGAGELGFFGRAENQGMGLDGHAVAAFTAGTRLRVSY